MYRTGDVVWWRFDGLLLVFTATRGEDDRGAVARGWEPHVDGMIANVDVDADHLGLANTAALEVIGPTLNRWLTPDDHRFTDADLGNTEGEDQR